MPSIKYISPRVSERRMKQAIILTDTAKTIMGEIGRICAVLDLTDSQFANIINMNPSTFSHKKHNPDTITVKEIDKMRKEFKDFELDFKKQINKVRDK